MVDTDKDTAADKLEGLYEWTIRDIVVNSIHLCYKDIWILAHIHAIILVGASF